LVERLVREEILAVFVGLLISLVKRQKTLFSQGKTDSGGLNHAISYPAEIHR
jgi:hypothetical protein